MTKPEDFISALAILIFGFVFLYGAVDAISKEVNQANRMTVEEVEIAR